MSREFAFNVARPYHPILLSRAEVEGGAVDEGEEVLRGIFPSGDQATEAMQRAKKPLPCPAPEVAAELIPVLSSSIVACGSARSVRWQIPITTRVCYRHPFAQRPKAFCCFRIGNPRKHSAQLFMVGGPCAPSTWHSVWYQSPRMPSRRLPAAEL